MNKISFFFLSAFLIIVSVFAGLDSVDISFQLIGSLLFIVLLGIPHGAIDHIIFLEDNSYSKAYLFLWFLFWLNGTVFIRLGDISNVEPYSFFDCYLLIISANHSSRSLLLINHLEIIFYILSWGCSILSGLIFYNIEDILSLSSLSADMFYLSAVFDKVVFSILLPLSSIVTVFILIVTLKRKQISSERFFFEIYLFILIHICFYILPLIVGFTLYFVILHSFKVLSEEFSYLKSRRKKFFRSVFFKVINSLYAD